MSSFAEASASPFHGAASFIKSASSTSSTQASTAQKLRVYALYKQATSGDAAGAQPWAVQVEARAKWDAHSALRGLASSDASAQYVAEVTLQARSLSLASPACAWQPPAPSAAAELAGLGLLPPVPAPPPWIRHAADDYYLPRWRAARALAARKRSYAVVPAGAPGAVCLHVVRHGEGIHNVLAAEHVRKGGTTPPYAPENLGEYPEMVDAPLTAKGIGEAESNGLLAKTPAPTHLVTSPLRRALDTGLISFGVPRDGSFPVLAHEGAREAFFSRNLCDLRRPLAVIEKEYPFVDFSRVPPDPAGAAHVGIEGETADSILDRLYGLLDFVMEDCGERGSGCAAVATHSVALFALTNGVLHFPEGAGREQWGMFGTGELRTLWVKREGA
jgi:acyl-CoA-binding protein/broad specificity phosphatase PhoE